MSKEPYKEWDLTEEDYAYFERLSKELVETKVAEYLARHTKPLMEESSLRKKMQEEVQRNIEECYTLAQMGYIHLMKQLPEFLESMDKNEAAQVEEEVSRWNEMLIDLGPYNEFLAKVLATKDTLQEAFYLTNVSMSCFYHLAKDLMQKKEYPISASIFYLLLQLNQGMFAFWQGLGTCYQLQKFYDEAIDAYTKGQHVNPHHPHFDLLIGECYLQQQQKELAEEHLHRAKEMMQEKEHDPLKAKIRRLLKKCKTLSQPK